MNYKCIQTVECKQGAIRAIRFNVDGSYCLSCGADSKIKLWNPQTSLLLKTYGGHGSDVLDVCGSCDSSQLVSGGSDKTIILWDVSTGLPVRRLRGHATDVTSVKFNEDSSVVVSGSWDNKVMCWDARSKATSPIQVLEHAKDSITSVNINKEEILSSSMDGFIRRYDIRMGQVFSDFIGEPVVCASFTRDGQCIIVSSSDNVIRLFDKNTGEMLNRYQGHKTEDYSVENGVDCNDKYIVTGSLDGNIWMYELVHGTVTEKLPHSSSSVISISVHPTQPALLSASGSAFKLWSSQIDNSIVLNDRLINK
uniref:WD repeat domain-containing protein 83 n=1 Tax=Clastoptera arizonana TaxID=38151 RepID=A0A1B6BYJ8_9HEMI